MAEMRESLKIVQQAIENLPAGPVNVGVDERTDAARQAAGLPDDRRDDHALRAGDEPIAASRCPARKSYAAIEAPNGELGFYLVGDGSDVAYRARCRPPSFIHFALFPHPDPRPHAQRRGGRPGQPEHHCRGIGSLKMSAERILTDEMIAAIRGVLFRAIRTGRR